MSEKSFYSRIIVVSDGVARGIARSPLATPLPPVIKASHTFCVFLSAGEKTPGALRESIQQHLQGNRLKSESLQRHMKGQRLNHRHCLTRRVHEHVPMFTSTLAGLGSPVFTFNN